MKIVARYSKLSDASFAQSLLVGDGIDAELQNVESSVNIVGGPPSIHVVVPDSDEERAQAAIQGLTFSAPAMVSPIKSSRGEFPVFRAIVKGIGVYQLVTGLTYLTTALLVQTGIRRPSATVSEGEYLLWFAFHIGVGFALLWGTGGFCRLALLKEQPSGKHDGETKP
jgi:hypothetical protein